MMGVGRYLVDSMLGPLVRWLRLAGHDAAFLGSELQGAERTMALSAALEDGRQFVTISPRLAGRYGGVVVGAELENAWAVLRPGVPGAFSRCSSCNGVLEQVERGEVREELPPTVADSDDQIHRCPDCSQLYWPGSHHEKIQNTLDRLVALE